MRLGRIKVVKLMLESKSKMWYTGDVTGAIELFLLLQVGINNQICYHHLSALAVAPKALPSVTRSRLATVKAVLFSGQKNRTSAMDTDPTKFFCPRKDDYVIILSYFSTSSNKIRDLFGPNTVPGLSAGVPGYAGGGCGPGPLIGRQPPAHSSQFPLNPPLAGPSQPDVRDGPASSLIGGGE
jgi:hypothetical protein